MRIGYRAYPSRLKSVASYSSRSKIQQSPPGDLGDPKLKLDLSDQLSYLCGPKVLVWTHFPRLSDQN
jgi:hypothetical protein